MVKLTSPDHPDFPALNATLEMLQTAANEINEAKRKYEAQQKLVKIQSLFLDPIQVKL